MKKYLKYKNFIPLDFIEKKKNKENKGNKRGFQVLILVNLILINVNQDLNNFKILKISNSFYLKLDI